MDYLHFEDDAGEHIEVKFQGIGEREKRKETIKKQGFGKVLFAVWLPYWPAKKSIAISEKITFVVKLLCISVSQYNETARML